jgi:hypothetical protein
MGYYRLWGTKGYGALQTTPGYGALLEVIAGALGADRPDGALS